MIHELVVMSLGAEVEVTGDYVFAKVNDEIAEQHQEAGVFAALQVDAGGHHLGDGCGEHESRAQGHEVLEIVLLPLAMSKQRAADDIGRTGGESEKDAECDWMHRLAAVPDVENVAVLHDVFLAFQPQLTGGTRGGLGAEFEQCIPGEWFRRG